MAKSLFFSWQADTNSKNGRGFLKDVLDEVCRQIATDTEVEEAFRDLEVDSDTQGVAGQPPIVDTIFKKIDSSGVFIADMTFTGKRVDGRPTPNPNVLIEYGWALKSLSHQRVLCVMNKFYGEPSRESLPFDLSHLRWPVCYSLADDASSKDRTGEKNKLVKILVKAVKASLATMPSMPVSEPKLFPAKHGLADRARFRAPNEAIGFDDGIFNEETLEVFLSHGSALWLRLMPLYDPNQKWAPHQLKSFATVGNQMKLSPIMSQATGFGFTRAADGFGIYASHFRAKTSSGIQTNSIAFAFDTGEIWSIDTSWLTFRGDSLPYAEKAYTDCLRQYSEFLQSLGLKPPFRWMAGMIGVKGRSFNFPLKPGFHRTRKGPICAAEYIVSEGTYDGQESPTKALLPFFNEIFEKCGLARPDHLPLE